MPERFHMPGDLARFYYPPPPWLLRGSALMASFRVAASAVRELIPFPLTLVVMPGDRAMAYLGVLRYGAGSTLEYSELIAGVVVRHGLRFHPYVTHIGVDSEASQRAGRELWYLPKQRWSFEWQFGELETGVRVWDGALLICDISGAPVNTRLFPLNTNTTFFNLRGTEVATITANLDVRMSPVAWGLQVGPDGPLAPLTPTGRVLTFAIKGMAELQGLKLLNESQE